LIIFEESKLAKIMQISVVNYLGELRTKSAHLASGETVISDAPLDNNGKGEAFSPTDFMVNSLAQCMITVMGIEARRLNVDLTGTTASVGKVMGIQPRRVTKIQIEINLPEQAKDFSKELETTAHNCPVVKSIHPNIELNVQFKYGNI
jgi:putative redox protein